ncbi:hypothetical protein HQ45_04230 [Porphyromonas crevioricanis]|nr:hypothetical protein HQ45_04230 [Porphyromonas crevioricanis]
MNRAFQEGRNSLLRKILLSPVLAKILSGENFCFLPCQQKVPPMSFKKERKNTAKMTPIRVEIAR